jgi:hypothetical protein
VAPWANSGIAPLLCRKRAAYRGGKPLSRASAIAHALFTSRHRAARAARGDIAGERGGVNRSGSRSSARASAPAWAASLASPYQNAGMKRRQIMLGGVNAAGGA